MEPAEIIANLKAYRVTHDRIAAVIGRDRTAATKMLNGSRSIKANEIAPLQGLVEEARRETGGVAPIALEPAPPRRMPGGAETGPLIVRGLVQAGLWEELGAAQAPAEPETYPAAPDPRYPAAVQWLSRVRGDSMNAMSRNGQPAGILDGDLVHLVDAIAIEYVPRTGDVVEVERIRFDGSEREITLKQVEVKPNGEVLLWPRSSNPRWKDPVPYLEGVRGKEHVEVRVRGKMLQVLRQF
jgi:hypothetical protein